MAVTLKPPDMPAVVGEGKPETLKPAAARTFVVCASPSTVTAGSSTTVTVTAKDAYGNVATGYAGTVHFTSSDNRATLPANSTLTNGTGTFTATLKAKGPQSITATDTLTASLTGSVNVSVT